MGYKKMIARKIIACVMLVCLTVCSVAYADIDLDSMTLDELNQLYISLVSRIQIHKQGDTVYNQNGISIVWKGVGKESLSFIISNASGKDYKIKVQDYGMLLGTHWNMDEVDLKDGFSYLSSSANKWLYDEETIGILGIDHVESVAIMIELKDINTGTTEELTISFAVDDDVQ